MIRKFLNFCFPILLVVVLQESAHPQTVQFKVKLVVTDVAISDTLNLGVSGDGGGPLLDNTIGVDNNPAYGIFQENAAAPLPPTNPFDARFVTIPGRVTTYPVGLGTGTFDDYRDFRDAAQVDSFRVSIQGDNLVTDNITVKWHKSLLQQFATAWTIKAIIGGTPFSPTDMLTTDSVAIPSDGLTTRYDLLIVKTGAITDPSLPIELASFGVASATDGTVQLRWTTVSEINNYGFEVEKAPAKEGGFQPVPQSFIPGHGTTIERHDYLFTDRTAGQTPVRYRLKQIDLDGTLHWSESVAASAATAPEVTPVPEVFALNQNYPNPFNPSTEIHYTLPVGGVARVRVFNLLGQEVASLINGFQEAGGHSVSFNASGLASGVYFCRLDSDHFTGVIRMLLLR